MGKVLPMCPVRTVTYVSGRSQLAPKLAELSLKHKPALRYSRLDMLLHLLEGPLLKLADPLPSDAIDLAEIFQGLRRFADAPLEEYVTLALA